MNNDVKLEFIWKAYAKRSVILFHIDEEIFSYAIVHSAYINDVFIHYTDFLVFSPRNVFFF